MQSIRIKGIEQAGKGVVARDAAHGAQRSDHQSFAKVVARRIAAPRDLNFFNNGPDSCNSAASFLFFQAKRIIFENRTTGN